jgi:hypothetical protein
MTARHGLALLNALDNVQANARLFGQYFLRETLAFADGQNTSGRKHGCELNMGQPAQVEAGKYMAAKHKPFPHSWRASYPG